MKISLPLVGPYHEEDLPKKFQVNAYYMQSIRDFLLKTYGESIEAAYEGLLKEINRLDSVKPIKRDPEIDIMACQKMLSLSWTSLIQIELAGWSVVKTNLPYTNAWIPIHTYYAVYGAAQAWNRALKQNDSSHSSSLRWLSNEIRERPTFPAPWNICLEGCKGANNLNFIGIPESFDVSGSFEVLSIPSHETFWPRYAKMIGTTRERRLKTSYEEWRKREKRKRMSPSQKGNCAKGLYATTIFDFLYRQRICSNYKEVDSMLLNTISIQTHEAYYDSYRTVAHLTTMIFEILLIKKIGTCAYLEILNTFLLRNSHTPEPLIFLEQRQTLFTK